MRVKGSCGIVLADKHLRPHVFILPPEFVKSLGVNKLSEHLTEVDELIAIGISPACLPDVFLLVFWRINKEDAPAAVGFLRKAGEVAAQFCRQVGEKPVMVWYE